MIVRHGLDVGRLATMVGPMLLVLLAYDVAVSAAYVIAGWQWVSIPDLPLPLLGSAIALVVSLRNNAGYDRWWEARKLWGSVVNNARSLARGLLSMTEDDALRASLVRHQIAYAIALRAHLLRRPAWDDLAPYLPAPLLAELRTAANVPAAIHNAMARAIATARREHALDSMDAAALDRTLSALADAQGGLERIKNTPMPRQYDQFPQIFTSIYCLLLPLGLVSDLGYFTPLGSTVIGFMFLALDRIGRDLEDPFENTIHDIPMLAITRAIEIDLLQSLGETEVPPPRTPERGVLW